MVNWKNSLYLILFFSLWGCGPEPYVVDVGLTNGSTTGRHIVPRMTITTVSEGKVNFAMGSVGGYPGAHSSGGRMDAPAYIEGEWAKGNPTPSSGLVSYHRISAAIPKDAEAKMKVMDNYYKNFKRDYGSMQVIVDGPRVRVFYTKGCSITLNDCTPKKNGDPNGWVVKDPKGTRDVVVLFDGIGESSATPFPDTHFSELESRKKANQ
ncbi:hypothetical protein [Vibrio metschnikovii]|uniref:hypothetical protein n=1 Tax=Vibrio metschnikovii TaxID=28172 RepID=UPI00164C6D2C|nr:hypothetical protein [Vibrio metschnikovii]MBC5832293.1 hypothetical protein [Vibrio metschnikovii]